MLTPFGKFCRKLRIDRNEILKDMASNLNVTVSYLSAVENGKRSIPGSWEHMISDTYNLNQEQRWELQDSIIESEKMIAFPLKETGENSTTLLKALARKSGDLSEEQLRKMFEILN
ncbi:helix-turn-helix transcriptional regulator [Exiguobacterium sp. A1_3_1]|uniref:helix-turn-helix domain-containing protein n=1 Tax=Exiguobacterium sp. A1_3_1 TaxID=2651871 RepID=UPI003B854527